MSHPAPKTLFVLEERELPSGEFYADENNEFSLSQASARAKAQSWADMEYDEDMEIEVRIVKYERVEVLAGTFRKVVE